jgi:hypothetical protein
VPHAIALGKLFQEFQRIQDKASREELVRLTDEAAIRLNAMSSLEPREPVDALILCSCLKEFILSLHPDNHLAEEFVRPYLAYMFGAAERIQNYITDATGVTLVAHGVNLTSEPWN